MTESFYFFILGFKPEFMNSRLKFDFINSGLKLLTFIYIYMVFTFNSFDSNLILHIDSEQKHYRIC